MPNASPDVDEAVDIVTLLSDLDEPSCEWTKVREEKCAERADWLMIASCGHHAYFCSPHSRRVKADLAKKALKILFCSRHEKRVDVEWRIVR